MTHVLAKAPSRSSDLRTANNADKGVFSGSRGFSTVPGHPSVQAKLAIGQPGDKYEREADRVADRVVAAPESVAMPDGGSQVGIPPIQRLPTGADDDLQRQTQNDEEEEETVQMKPAAGRSSAPTARATSPIGDLGGGRPLPAATRAFFEPRFGHDFSQVRIHTDARAGDAARSINARAFTRGRDLAFGAGQFAPETASGRKLLAHELTHVVQQGGGGQPGSNRIQRKAAAGHASSAAPTSHPALQGGGQPLAAPLRSYFEPRYQRDFSAVRVHNGPQAASLARSADARAVTIGQDIAFAPRQYAPGTRAGRWLLGHELAHVAQQTNGAATAGTGPMLETEADRAADAVVSGQSFRPRHAARPRQHLTVPVATGPGRVEFPSSDRMILNNFDIERDTMKPEWLGGIAIVALILNLNPCKEAEIEGHTDSSGTEAFNLGLSGRRAHTIQQALEALVLEPAVASPLTLGFGENRPIDTNATEAGRARNRRVEIRLVDRPLPAIDRVELLNGPASQTFVIGATPPVPRSDHGVTVAREVAPDARVRAVLNPALAPGDRRRELVQWTGATQNPADPVEADVSRAAGQNVAVARIACPLAAAPASPAQFTVWSVDATITSAVPNTRVGTVHGGRQITMDELIFNALVTPVTLFSTADAPDMRGVAVPATPVPGAGTPHPMLGGDLANGVNSRWDISRRIRTKYLYPAHIPAAGLDVINVGLGFAFIGVPVPAYPGNRLIGNDDRGTGDPEDNDPYVDGRMSGRDRVNFYVSNSVGNHRDTFDVRWHFQEFIRLDLGGRWRQISDDHPWKLHYSFVKFNVLGIDFWLSTGSSGALDNAGF